jgi:hypothetical protein
MPCPSHPSWLDHSKYTWRRVQVTKLLITQLRHRLFKINFEYSVHRKNTHAITPYRIIECTAVLISLWLKMSLSWSLMKARHGQQKRLVAILPSCIHQWLYSPLLGPGRFFNFVILHTVGRTPWTWDQLVARPLPTHRTTQAQNKRTQTYMPQVGFEPTIPVLERAKTVHALDCAVTVIGSHLTLF